MSTVPVLRAAVDCKTDFPGLLNAGGTAWHYLDSAATAQKPQAVIDAVTKAIGADYATVHRGVYTRSAEMTLGYEAARRRVAQFIGGREDEVVFTRGATEAINLVAYSYPDKGRVLLSELEHHSNIVPWQLAGWQIDVCPITDDGRIDLDAADRMLTPGHKMVSFAHVSNVLGSVLDVERAAEMTHRVGAKLLLHDHVKIDATTTLAVIGGTIAIGVAASLLRGGASAPASARPGSTPLPAESDQHRH